MNSHPCSMVFCSRQVNRSVWISACLVLALSIAPANGQESENNVVVNGSFERWLRQTVVVGNWRKGGDNIRRVMLPEGWSVYSWGNRKADTTQFTADDTVRRKGKSARISAVSSHVTQAAYVTPEIPIRPNTSYRLEGWVKTQLGKGQRARLFVLWRSDPKSEFREIPTEAISGDCDWKRVILSISPKDIPNAEKICVGCGVEGSNPQGVAWFDEVRLVPVEKASGKKETPAKVEKIPPARKVEDDPRSASVKGQEFLKQPLRGEQSLNGTWKVSRPVGSRRRLTRKKDIGYQKGYEKKEFDDTPWPNISVPSIWYATVAKSFLATTARTPFVTGWYRKTFRVSRIPDQPNVILRFNRVGARATVYVNGHKVGTHSGAYTAFEFDITKYVRFDAENVLAVRCEDSFAPWFGGPLAERAFGTMFGVSSGRPFLQDTHGGICGSVQLQTAPLCRVESTRITSQLAESRIQVEALIQNLSGKPQTFSVLARVVGEKDARTIGQAYLGRYTFTPGKNILPFTLKLDSPMCWSPETPVLYDLQIDLVNSEKTVESARERFGYRDFRIVGNAFYLNGRRYPLFMAKIEGYMSEALIPRLRDQIMASTMRGGFNIGRTIGGPPPEEILDYADRKGFMIYSEWAYNFLYKPYDIDEPAFVRNNLREMREWIRQQHNHPSVVMWSLANEPGSSPKTKRILHALYEGIRKEDTQGRPISTSGGPALEFVDVHNYTGGLGGNPWTFMPGSIQNYIDTEKRRDTPRPIVIGESIGYGWGSAPIRIPYDQDMPIDQYVKWVGGASAGGDALASAWLGKVGVRGWMDQSGVSGPPRAAVFYGKRILEIFRRRQKYIQGATPFSYASNLPALKAMTQPVLVCLDNVALQQHVFSPSKLPLRIFAVNDSLETLTELRGTARLEDTKGTPRAQQEFSFDSPIENGKTGVTEAKLAIPPGLKEGVYTLRLKLQIKDTPVSQNTYKLCVIPATVLSPLKQKALAVGVLSPSENSASSVVQMLRRMGIAPRLIRDLSQAVEYPVVIVPPNAEKRKWQEVYGPLTEPLKQWLKKGGRLLFLEQTIRGKVPWFEGLTFGKGQSTFVEIVRRDHPAFQGMTWANFDTWLGRRGLIVETLLAPVNPCVLAASAGNAREIAGMAVAEIKMGKGLVLFSQPLATERFGKDASATRYLCNLVRYVLSPEAGRTARALPQRRRFHLSAQLCVPVDLSQHANMAFADKTAGDQHGGMFDDGSDVLAQFPTGNVKFRGVPFTVLTPTTNDQKSCIVMGSLRIPYLPKEVKGIPLGRKAFSHLYFLETAYWVKSSQPVATYRIRYADGTTYEFDVQTQRDVGDWFQPRNYPNALVAWQNENLRFGVYLREWKNPYPSKDIDFIDILSAGKESSLAVFGITGLKYVKPY